MKVHELLLPHASVAVLVTVVVPAGKTNPLAGTLATLVTVQLSVAVTTNVTLLLHEPGTASTVMFAGQTIAGGDVSTVHVTVRAAVLLLPHASVAVNVRVCVRVQPLVATPLSDAPSVTV